MILHAYRRCRQVRAELVRWQRQLLTLVDAPDPPASSSVKPGSGKLGVSPSVKKSRSRRS
jgi:hypothetical protein